MRLHTSLTKLDLERALQCAKIKGRIASDVQFTVLEPHGSSTHQRAYEVQLGVSKDGPYRPLPANYVNQDGKRQKTRRTNMSKDAYAATYHEWGWFIAEVFKTDPNSQWGSKSMSPYSWGYVHPADFHAKTGGKFR